MKQRPDVYTYHDYRAFLNDWIKHSKTVDPEFSIRRFAKEAGISHGYLPHILNGTRNFSKKAINNIVPNLNLNSSELKYFLLLCDLGNANKQSDRLKTLRSIQKFREYRNLNPKEFEVYRYLTKWYFVAIREMVNLPDFQLDAHWIQKRLRKKVTIPYIQRAIDFLTGYGFIVIDKDGKAALPEKEIKCMSGVYRVAMAQFHKEALALAADAIDTVPRAFRKHNAYALSISADNVDEVRRILDEAIEKVASLEKKTTLPELVYYVSVSGFPMTNHPSIKEPDDDQ